MITSRHEILTNAITTAELSYVRMEEGKANEYAEVLKKNTSIENLILSRCSLTDDEFDILAKALIERNIELNILDLDFNYLTPAILPTIKELIEKQLVLNLCIYNNVALLKDIDCLREFKKLAEENRMGIFTSNPLIREEKYPTIFGTHLIKKQNDDTQVSASKESSNTTEKMQDELKEGTIPYISPTPGSSY